MHKLGFKVTEDGKRPEHFGFKKARGCTVNVDKQMQFVQLLFVKKKQNMCSSHNRHQTVFTPIFSAFAPFL